MPSLEELEKQIADLVSSLQEARQVGSTLEHAALELKGLELLTKIRSAKQKVKGVGLEQEDRKALREAMKKAAQ